MVGDNSKTLEDLVEYVDRYPGEAFLFVRDALGFAAERVHGKETDAHRKLQHYLMMKQIDWNDLIAMYHANELPDSIVDIIDEAGGYENLNRHVDGKQLCWGLRDFAIVRWGMLAQTVLATWNITETYDFGRIVFGFIELDMMQKQSDDTLSDFENVYSFDESFTSPFRNGLDDVEHHLRNN